MAQLLGELGTHKIDRLIEVVAAIFGVDVWPRQGDVNFDNEGMLGDLTGVVINSNVGTYDVLVEVLEVADFIGDVGMNGSS